MANHGPVYGLSLEIQKKNQSRFVLREAQEVLEWVQNCTGVSFLKSTYDMTSDIEVADAIRDGVQLCRLMERILGPGKIRYITRPIMPFHMMENISTFLTAAKFYGVPEITCFQTVELYENKQLYKVFECIRALAAIASKNNAHVPYAKFIIKVNDPNPREFPQHVLDQRNVVIPMQHETNKGASQKGMLPYGLSRQILPDKI